MKGCGFFPDGYFDEIGGFDSLQVRILGPKLGLAKGMLLKKQGISRIQLPKSMIKAPPSRTCDDDCLTLIIKNCFPSDENKQLGRFLNPEAEPQKSWVKKKKKPLSDMYQRMLVGFGVEQSVVEEYTKSAEKVKKKLKHGKGNRWVHMANSTRFRFLSKSNICLAHLKGCVDPTGALPENKVFISGYTTDSKNNRVLFGDAHAKIFLSRSPCLAPTDAKLVSVVGSKPEDMCMDDWDMLCSYDFGTIFFPQSLNSLACIIAGEDCAFYSFGDFTLISPLHASFSKIRWRSRWRW
jgi:hypothetical protein